ncbi:MAG: FAD-binding protein [Sphingomonadales bacterium]|nr:FAD-binding protein [Sphingomonadales bacterium]
MTPDHTYLEDLTETSTRVEPALVVENPDGVNWDADCDVMVVGVGLAGVCAALRTAEDNTLPVMAIDRGEGGGASQLSGGIVYMGGGTRAQQEAGVADTPENMANYLAYETGEIVRPDTVRRFAEASVHFQDWLEKYGARFGGPATEEKTSYPYDKSLYFSGNELTVPGRELASPAQRGHRAKPAKGEPTDLAGQYLLPPLIASMEALPNVRFLRQTRATRMVVDRQGTVVGIEVLSVPRGLSAWKHAKAMALSGNLIVGAMGLSKKMFATITGIERAKAKPMRIRVRRGVVLSAGGFTYNRAMMARTALPAYLKSHPLGTIADDGSGIKLGMTVGGKTAMLDRISAWKFLYPPASFCKSCSVGPDGKRLVGEEYYGARTGDAVFQTGEGKGWLITDEPLWQTICGEIDAMKKVFFQKVQFKAIKGEYTVSAPTLDELAAKIGVPADEMRATLAAYNGHIARGEGDPLGKSEKYRQTIEQGPFHATDIGAALKLNPIPALTMGGLVVDEDTGEVLSSEGGVVRGLYAAGRTAIGICSHNYVSGLSLGDCVWSGCRAGESIKGNGGAKALVP